MNFKAYVKQVPRIFLLMPSLDLLWLYLVKAWYDPNKLVEYAELAAVLFFCGFSVVWFVKGVKEVMKQGRKI